MTTPINDLELQRCVDGELPAFERRALLERLEATEGGWKTLALAFLENQDFDAAGGEFRQCLPATPVMLAANSSKIPRRSSTWAVQSLALAASLVAAFWIGKQGARPALNSDVEDGRNLASQTYAPDPSASGQRGVMKPAAMLELPFSHENESLQIPVYDSQTLDEDGPEISLWPDLNKKGSLEPGYRLTSERNVISIPLESGGTVFVPVEVSGVRYAVQ